MEDSQKIPLRIIGVGNCDRGDDAVGVRLAQELKSQYPEMADFHCVDNDGTRLLDLLDGAEMVVIIDAVYSGGEPGVVRCFDVSDKAAPAELFGASTHQIGVAEAIELARVLGTLPHTCLIVGIEGEDYGFGAPLSPAVHKALPKAMYWIKSILDNRSRPSAAGAL
jgi:hydrogenase maturation protease